MEMIYSHSSLFAFLFRNLLLMFNLAYSEVYFEEGIQSESSESLEPALESRGSPLV